MKLCECGCGGEVNEGNRYVRGHNSRCFTEETKKKIGNGNKGKTLSEEHKKKISESLKGKKHTEETKEKISKSLKGNENTKGFKHTEKTRKKMSESHKGQQTFLGHKHSEETKKKISLANKGNKGHFHSKKTKQKLSKINRGSNNPNFIHGRDFILNQHKKYKKQECIFSCEDAKRYDLHHEPKMIYENILEWEGQLINLCRSCHKRVHDGILELPVNEGIKWALKDTENFKRS